MVLQGLDLARQMLNLVKRHDAHLGVFQGHGIAGVVVADDAVQTHDFTCHLKAGDLLAPVFGGDKGFEKPRADGVQGVEAVAIAEQIGTALDFALGLDHFFDAQQILIAQSHGHAQLAQVAVGTSDFDGRWVHGGRPILMNIKP